MHKHMHQYYTEMTGYGPSLQWIISTTNGVLSSASFTLYMADHVQDESFPLARDVCARPGGPKRKKVSPKSQTQLGQHFEGN